MEGEEVARTFGSNVLQARLRADLPEEDLSFAASLHRTEIGMLERGVRVARIDTLVKLCGALGITPNDLLEGIFWTPAEQPRGYFASEPGASTNG